jgi:hypothetical protein
MKRECNLQPGRIITALVAVIAVAWLVKIASRPLPPRLGGDNPQAFYLQATGSEFSYTFTYDPRKTDRWRFGTDGGAGIQTTNNHNPEIGARDAE